MRPSVIAIFTRFKSFVPPFFEHEFRQGMARITNVCGLLIRQGRIVEKLLYALDR